MAGEEVLPQAGFTMNGHYGDTGLGWPAFLGQKTCIPACLCNTMIDIISSLFSVFAFSASSLKKKSQILKEMQFELETVVHYSSRAGIVALYYIRFYNFICFIYIFFI